MSDLHPIDGIKRYVVGFMFSPDRQNVVLIRKNRPEWQKGKLNGVGGKVEASDASEAHAMSREFYEETGIAMDPSAWNLFAILRGQDYDVHVFKNFSNLFDAAETKTDEEVVTLHPGRAFFTDTVPNLGILLQIALQPQIQLAELHY